MMPEISTRKIINFLASWSCYPIKVFSKLPLIAVRFAEGIPALLHKANVHRKIFLQQILNFPKGILPTSAFAFDEGQKTTALINHKSEFLVQIFSNVVFNLNFSRKLSKLFLKYSILKFWWSIVSSELHQPVLFRSEALQNWPCNVFLKLTLVQGVATALKWCSLQNMAVQC